MAKRWMLTIGMAALLAVSAAAQDSLAVAADFDMLTREGRKTRLADVAAARATLLMLYDPDCSDCRQELFAMRHSSRLRRSVAEGRLRVVCVYAGRDEALWRSTAGELPPSWMSAMALTDVDDRYDLSAMPLLLLLDDQRHVAGRANELRDLAGSPLW